MEGGGQALPFVRMFYGSPSSYSWEDSCGVSHTIRQGEGGEQGDALMPLLFALGQHRALVATQSELQDGEFLFRVFGRHLRGVPPDRVGAVYASMQQHLWAHCRIRVHTGKTQVWNREGVRPHSLRSVGTYRCGTDPQHGCGEDQATRISPKPGLPSGPAGQIVCRWSCQTSRCGHPIRRELGRRPRHPVVGGCCFCHVVAHRYHGVRTSFVASVGGGSSS